MTENFQAFVAVVVVSLVGLTLAAPEGDQAHVHGPVLVAAHQPGFVPVAPGHFFTHPQFFAPAHGPVFVHAPPPAVISRPPGTFVILSHPDVRPVVPLVVAPATTATPSTEAPTTATPATTAAPEPAPADYNFQYGVSDATSGVNLGHNENNNGKNNLLLHLISSGLSDQSNGVSSIACGL